MGMLEYVRGINHHMIAMVHRSDRKKSSYQKFQGKSCPRVVWDYYLVCEL